VTCKAEHILLSVYWLPHHLSFISFVACLCGCHFSIFLSYQHRQLVISSAVLPLQSSLYPRLTCAMPRFPSLCHVHECQPDHKILINKLHKNAGSHTPSHAPSDASRGNIDLSEPRQYLTLPLKFSIFSDGLRSCHHTLSSPLTLATPNPITPTIIHERRSRSPMPIKSSRELKRRRDVQNLRDAAVMWESAYPPMSRSTRCSRITFFILDVYTGPLSTDSSEKRASSAYALRPLNIYSCRSSLTGSSNDSHSEFQLLSLHRLYPRS
jgi:hypothetical protein